eukprot:scaffold7139_cov115-Cylindrotheca_fusiformis.AAC.3
MTWTVSSASRARPPHQDENDVIDLCDSDDQETPSPRKSLGSTYNDAICLSSDEEEVSYVTNRRQTQGMSAEPTTASNNGNTERARRRPQWEPRYSIKTEARIRGEGQEVSRALGTSSNAICIDSDDEDDDDEWKKNSTQWNSSGRRLTTPTRRQIAGTVSSRTKLTAMKKASEAPCLMDSSDHEELEIVLQRRAERLLGNKQEEGATHTPDESDNESNTSSIECIVPREFLPPPRQDSSFSKIAEAKVSLEQSKAKNDSSVELKPSSIGPNTSPFRHSVGKTVFLRQQISGFALLEAAGTAVKDEEDSQGENDGLASGQNEVEEQCTPLLVPMKKRRDEVSPASKLLVQNSPIVQAVARSALLVDRENSAVLGCGSPRTPDISSANSLGSSSVDAGEDEIFEGGVDDPIKKSAGVLDNADYHMTKIEHLCWTGANPDTTLPMHKFSVFGSPDDIMYDFVLNVKSSSIPDAGRGVFLTFLGARELKPSRRRWGRRLQELREDFCPLRTAEPLTAIHPDGFGITVRLEGQHLHGPYNCQSLLRTLKATIPGRDKSITVRFSNYEDPYCAEELAGMRKDVGRIGFLGLFTEEDYVPAPRRTFSSLHENCGLIEMGRYGPFQPSDRKILSTFDVKAFVFSTIPNEWAFGVNEKLHGREQVIDITDDMTGDPHTYACGNIPMYVNEVGHDRSLRQTVHALLDDDRTVQYFIAIEEPMKKGDTIELLVAYDDTYEKVRERKGYGLANLERSEKSDEHFATRLKRNFTERKEVEEMIAGLCLIDVYLTIDWLQSLNCRLENQADVLIQEASKWQGGSHSAERNWPLSQQLVALQRISWVSRRLRKRLNSLSAPSKKMEQGIIEQSKSGIHGIKWPLWPQLISVLEKNPDIEDSNEKNFKQAFEAEAVEEICYAIRKRLPRPMDESLWCGVSRKLIHSLCTATAKAKRVGNDEGFLCTEFTNLGLEASNDIRQANTIQLAFSPRFEGSSSVLKDRKRSYTTSEVIARSTESDNPGFNCLSPEMSSEVQGVPMALEQATRPQIHESWYLCWQVIYVIDCFARQFLRRSTYSLENLCSVFGVDSNAVRVAFQDIDFGRRNKKRKMASRHCEEQRNKRTPKNAANLSTSGEKKRAVNRLFFWNIIWTCLSRECGWSHECGARPTDSYFLPPGVARGTGFKTRVDFFDSIRQVMAEVKSNPKWSSLPAVKKALEEYESCITLYEKIKGTGRMPKYKQREELVTWFRKQVA